MSVEFPVNSRVFFLGTKYYGAAAQVDSHDARGNLTIRIFVHQNAQDSEPLFGREIAQRSEGGSNYFPSHQVSKMVGVSGLALSKITSSLHVISKSADQRMNIGLNLKFESKKLKVSGYTRKSATGWEFSAAALALIQEYRVSLPPGNPRESLTNLPNLPCVEQIP